MQKVVSVCVVRERKNRGIPDEICAEVQQKHAITYTMRTREAATTSGNLQYSGEEMKQVD
jgi:hypothetical protein